MLLGESIGGRWFMVLELLVRERKRIPINGISVEIITEQRIGSFKRRCKFKNAVEKTKGTILQCGIIGAFLKADLLGK
jgi:hypothetical protein